MNIYLRGSMLACHVSGSGFNAQRWNISHDAQHSAGTSPMMLRSNISFASVPFTSSPLQAPLLFVIFSLAECSICFSLDNLFPSVEKAWLFLELRTQKVGGASSATRKELSLPSHPLSSLCFGSYVCLFLFVWVGFWWGRDCLFLCFLFLSSFKFFPQLWNNQSLFSL